MRLCAVEKRTVSRVVSMQDAAVDEHAPAVKVLPNMSQFGSAWPFVMTFTTL